MLDRLSVCLFSCMFFCLCMYLFLHWFVVLIDFCGCFFVCLCDYLMMFICAFSLPAPMLQVLPFFHAQSMDCCHAQLMDSQLRDQAQLRDQSQLCEIIHVHSVFNGCCLVVHRFVVMCVGIARRHVYVRPAQCMLACFFASLHVG